MNPPDEAEAERCLRTWIDIARSQQARFWELRATTSLARLLRSKGNLDSAMLAEICGWFTEGFEFCRPQRRRSAAGGTEHLKGDAGQDALFEMRLRKS